MSKRETVTVGLIAGRHDLPVSEFIFDEIGNVLDFKAISDHISNFISTRVGVGSASGCGVNQRDYSDVELFAGTRDLVVYVTGLTAVSTALVAVCALNGVDLTLMHFDRNSGEYVPQPFFFNPS